MTIIHPFHPLRGQQVPVVRLQGKEPEPELLIQLPDESFTLIDIGSTDYALSIDDQTPAVNTHHLLDFAGLCQAARLVKRLRAESQQSVKTNPDHRDHLFYDEDKR